MKNRARRGLILLAMGAGAWLAACATVPPGEDDEGKALRAKTQPLLTGLVGYKQQHGEYPTSLYELVPKYIDAVPFDPAITYQREAGVIGFGYSDWGDVTCRAHLGETEWTCRYGN